MKTINLTQGSPEWSAHRAQHFNASDAPAMLGCSPYTTRAQLIRARATGLAPDVDAATQRRFDNGHRFESLARPLAEKIVGEELYPVVGVEGPYSASFDGLTLLEDVAFEHKTLGKRLQDAMHDGCTGADLPEDYRAQMEHQCMVSGVERVLFMASNWADDGTLLEERHCWYTPDPEMRARLVAGWKQFAADLAAYTPEPAAVPAPSGRAPDTLPAVRLEVTGAVTASNLADFKTHALAVIGAINRDLQTDADFADAEKTVKWCAEAESRLKAAKDNAIAQTATIEEAFRIVDDVSAELRRTRLDLEKLVKAEKEARREAIVTDAAALLGKHIAALSAGRARGYMPPIGHDFAGAIKGKKSLDSMRDAVATELARAKIAANETADRIQINLVTIQRLAGGYTGMFPDEQVLVLKSPEDCELAVQARVDKRKAEDQSRLDAERERIRAEEQARADAAARVELERQRATDEASRKERDEAERAAAVSADADRNGPDSLASHFVGNPASTLADSLLTPAPQLQQVQRAPATNESTTSGAPTLRIGAIAERLGFSLTADQLRGLGITPAGKDKAAVLFHEAQFQQICDALIRRATQAKAEHAQRLAA